MKEQKIMCNNIMVNKILMTLVFFLINITIEKNMKINIIDNLISSSYIIPVVSPNNYLYIIAGENSKISPNDIYKRVILKYDINSRKIINNLTIDSKFPFENAEVIFAGDNLEEYLFTITFDSIGLYDFKNNKETIYPVKGIRRFLKKGDNLFYYGYVSPEKENQIMIAKIQLIKEDINCDIYDYNRKECGYMGIDQFKCENRGCCWKPGKDYDPLHPEDDYPWCFYGEINNNLNYFLASPFYKLEKLSNNNLVTIQTMISCDFTDDYSYLVCVSISQNIFTISAFNKDLELIQSYQKENYLGFQKDDFIKIIYFNDTYNFISLNTINAVTTRLRFFRYDGNYTSKLDSITNNGNQYLDVEKTQLSGYSYENDIMALSNDSIIKISTANYRMIVTIFQFYENNKLLFVKIYSLDTYNFDFKYFFNPRLSLFKNSVLVCFSTVDNNDANKTGYFVFNNLNSNDTTLTSNIIKMNELVSLTSELFSLELKIRVLKIPKDLILLNKLNNIEIGEKKDFELNDEFILRQYRIKEVSSIIFKGIAIGNDGSYSSWRTYPSNREKPEPINIFIEGEERNIYINFNDCLEGYYHLDYDYNLCTNLKPRGYYLDNETKTYRSFCHNNCLECDFPPIDQDHMECITCKNGYNMTEDTNSCYDNLPPQYYLDGNLYKRCHPGCYSCISSPKNNSMNCLSCISSEYDYNNETHNCILHKSQKQELPYQSNLPIIICISIFLVFILIVLIISARFCCIKRKNDENDVYKPVSDIGIIPKKSGAELGSINSYS